FIPAFLTILMDLRIRRIFPWIFGLLRFIRQDLAMIFVGWLHPAGAISLGFRWGGAKNPARSGKLGGRMGQVGCPDGRIALFWLFLFHDLPLLGCFIRLFSPPGLVFCLGFFGGG